MFYFLYRYRNCGKWRQSKFCHDYLSYKKREDENLPFSVTPEGLEPSTQWLRVICSTNWATESFAGTKVMLFAEPTKVFCRFLFDEVNFFSFAGVLPRWKMALELPQLSCQGIYSRHWPESLLMSMTSLSALTKKSTVWNFEWRYIPNIRDCVW